MRQGSLIVFAREPQEGKVKTRLLHYLAPAVVTELYKAFLKDVFKTARRVRCKNKFIFYAGSPRSIPFLRENGRGFILKPQRGKDLGARMLSAFRFCANKNLGSSIVIGSDCVELSAKDVERALKRLSRYDCVLGPAKDGGYYLIGLNRPFAPAFQGIDWSTRRVLSQTLKVLNSHKRRVSLLAVREDIDTLAGLKKLAKRIERLKNASYTKKQLKKILLP